MEPENRIMEISDIDYDFESPKSEKEIKTDLRSNLHIVRCCANCKFYLAKRNRSNAGACQYPDPSVKNPEPQLPSHGTLVCDLYQLRGQKMSIARVGKYVGKEFLNDGTMKEE